MQILFFFATICLHSKHSYIIKQINFCKPLKTPLYFSPAFETTPLLAKSKNTSQLLARTRINFASVQPLRQRATLRAPSRIVPTTTAGLWRAAHHRQLSNISPARAGGEQESWRKGERAEDGRKLSQVHRSIVISGGNSRHRCRARESVAASSEREKETPRARGAKRARGNLSRSRGREMSGLLPRAASFSRCAAFISARGTHVQRDGWLYSSARA